VRKVRESPNVLFISTDQQTWDAVSAYGNPHVNTPNIDRLVEHGVSFMRSYCTDPVCAAARASWMTGLYTSENGVPFNGGLMHDDIPDLGQILEQDGIPAYHAGKWHVDGREVRTSFRNLYQGKTDIGASGGEFHDRVTVRAAVDFLDHHQGGEPFYLQVHLVNPHEICEYGHNHAFKIIPGPIEQDIVKEAELPPLPPNFVYDNRETVVQQVFRRGERPLIHADNKNGMKNWTEEQWRFMSWNLYRYVEDADQNIGVILNALEASRHFENTLVVLCGDHGEAAGRHHTFQKFALYEESIRVPTIIASLGDNLKVNKGTFDRDHFVSGVDILPTFLDYLEVKASSNLQGKSLRPLVEGRAVEWPDYAYIESNYWARALLTDSYKYVTEYRPKKVEDYLPQGPDPDSLGHEQLFDLHEDPWETKNLAFEPSMLNVLQDFRTRLFEHERNLHRRPLREGGPRKVVDAWGDALRSRWQQVDS